MKLYIRRCMHMILIILKLCADKVGATVPCDLAVVCGLMNGTDTIPNPPIQCTALAVSRNPGNLNNVKMMKGDLPLVLVEDTIWYEDWNHIFQTGADAYIKDLLQFDIGVIIFKNLYKETVTKLDKGFNEELLKFICQLKLINPELLIGIFIPTDVKVVQACIDIELIQSDIDFFLIDTCMYRTCNHHKKQSDMEAVTTQKDIENTVNELSNAGVCICKMMFIIRLRVFSVKGSDHEDMTYSILCEKKMSKNRHYCIEMIQTAFEKARYSYQQNMVGIFIQDLEYDDVRGTCQCAGKDGSNERFPLLRVIAGASANEDQPVEDFLCVTGDFPIIRK